MFHVFFESKFEQLSNAETGGSLDMTQLHIFPNLRSTEASLVAIMEEKESHVCIHRMLHGKKSKSES